MVLAGAADRPATRRRGEARQTLDVALVVPLQGSAGLFGPSCELCAELAVLEVNADGVCWVASSACGWWTAATVLSVWLIASTRSSPAEKSTR